MKNLKIWLVALASVITLNLFFNANKRYNIEYSYKYSINKMTDLTPTEYREILKAAKDYELKGVIYSKTRAYFFKTLPEKTIYVFYPLYLVIASGLILSINWKK